MSDPGYSAARPLAQENQTSQFRDQHGALIPWSELSDAQRAAIESRPPLVKRSHAQSIWSRAARITPGTPGAVFLTSQGIRPPWPRSIRYVPSRWCGALQDHLPALVARVVDPLNRDHLQALQATWIDRDGAGALRVTARRLIGDSSQGVCCFGDVDAEEVIVCRQVLDALAVRAFFDRGSIAVLSDHRAANFKLPKSVRRVIFAVRPIIDAGAPQFDLPTRLKAMGIAVNVVEPPCGARSWTAAARASR